MEEYEAASQYEFSQDSCPQELAYLWHSGDNSIDNFLINLKDTKDETCKDSAEEEDLSSQITEFEEEKSKSTHISVHKGCHCKKSKCLKLYCECYAQGRKCGSECFCLGCENHSDSSQDRKVPKSRKTTKFPIQTKLSETVIPCNCKKTHCQKRYCECFNAGRPCTSACNCIECHNCVRGLEQQKEDSLQIEWAYNKSSIVVADKSCQQNQQMTKSLFQDRICRENSIQHSDLMGKSSPSQQTCASESQPAFEDCDRFLL